MILSERFDGGDQPFEGQRQLSLEGIPAGAKVLSARAVVSPVLNENGEAPVETLVFSGQAWGATRVQQNFVGDQPGWVEVDFHARRTLHAVVGSNLVGADPETNASLEIDLGGAFAEVKNNGTLFTPADQESDRLRLASNNATLPGLTVARFRLTRDQANPDIHAVRVRGVPRNVSLRLGAEPSFFNHPGEMTRATISGDFGELLAAFLAEDEPDSGFHRVPLVLTTDALGRLDVEVEIELLQRQSVLPTGLDEVTVPYAFGSLPEGDHGVLDVTLPPGVRVRATEGQAIGAFEGSRIVHGPDGEITTTGEAPVTPEAVQAQRLALPTRLKTTAVDLLLAAVSRAASLEVDLLEDLDGKPGGDSLLARPATVAIDRDNAGQPTWVSVPLGAEVQLEAAEDRRYWLAVKSLEGEAHWLVAAGGEQGSLQHTADGGLSWRGTEISGAPSPKALSRLRRQPETFEMPVELQVGVGDAARRVSFAAQEARGRVELDLSQPEVAQTFNQVLDSTPPACSEAEHLDNADLDQWFALGDALGAPEQIRLADANNGLLVAPSPDSRWAYTVNHTFDVVSSFQVIDLPCRRVRHTIGLGDFGLPQGLAIHPAGQRAYIALANSLHVVDLAQPRLLGSIQQLLVSPTGLALSPDGDRLYLATESSAGTTGFGGRIELLSTARLEEAVVTGAASDAAGLPGDPDLPSTSLNGVRDLAMSADGGRLFALATNPAIGSSELHVLDALNLVPAIPSMALDNTAQALAVGADGSLLAVVSSSGELRLLDAVDLSQEASISLPEGAHGIALEPGGRRAFAATSSQVVVVDLKAQRQLESLDTLGTSLTGLAVPPAGDNLLVSAVGEGELNVVPIGSPLPEEWAVTGPVRRECLAGSQVLVLGHQENDREAESDVAIGISQVTPVTADCGYQLTVVGIGTVTDARIEVFWNGDGCQPMRGDSFPLPQVSGNTRELPQVTHRLSSPLGAHQAEVRVRAPEGLMGLAKVSLRGTAEALENGGLQPAPGAPPTGWQLATEQPGFSAIATPDGGTRLISSGGPSVLTQTVTVTAGDLYELSFSGDSATAGAPQAASLQAQWLGAADETVATPTTLDLASQAGGPRRAAGTVPEGTQQARLELRLEEGTSLTVRALSFALRAPQRLPAVFVSQAPGELRLRDVHIAFEPAEPKRPAPPETGLCAPTPPDAEPGEPCGDKGCCSCCGNKTEVREGNAMVTAAGRAVTVSTCENCATPVVSFGGRPRPEAEVFRSRRLPAALSRPHAAPPPPLSAALFLSSTRRSVARPAADLPLTAIIGIADKRAAQLAAVGIDTVAKLARADPEILTRLPMLSRPLADNLIAQARTRLS